jgi:hypothetical protein
MINVIRWLCVIPASYLGYYLALVGGMAALVLAESFCPAEAVVSETCTADYMRPVEKTLFIVFPGLSAILVVLLPTLMAPAKKVAVAGLFFVLGSAAAIYMGSLLKEWVVLGIALSSGGITLYSIYAYHNKRKHARK